MIHSKGNTAIFAASYMINSLHDGRNLKKSYQQGFSMDLERFPKFQIHFWHPPPEKNAQRTHKERTNVGPRIAPTVHLKGKKGFWTHSGIHTYSTLPSHFFRNRTVFEIEDFMEKINSQNLEHCENQKFDL